MGRRLAFLVTVAAVLVFPGSSPAATGQLQNGVMIYTADSGESNNVVFTTNTFGSPTFEVRDQPTVAITPTPPCFNGGQANIMECPQDGGGTGQVVLFQASLGDGNDTISLQADLPTSIGAGGGADAMSGGPAADFLRGGQQDDTITGGGGNDQLTGDDPGVAGGGNDSLDGGDGNDSEDGQDGNDTVRGGHGNDTLQGGGGNDVFPAESGSDGTDDVHGGDGNDTATFAARTDGVQLSLDDQPNDGQIGNASDNIHTDVENLVGGSANDTLTGDGDANGLTGGAGNDTASGGDGADTIDGGDGADALSGDGGDDSLAGGAGDDNAHGGDGNDTEQGGDGADSLSGDGGDDALDGGAGDDSASGGDGADTVGGGDGNDLLGGDAGDDSLNGGAGADSESGGEGNDALAGADGDDSEAGGPGADSLAGDGGNDLLDGGPGADGFAGGDGTDTADYSSRSADVAVTLDDAGGDGESGEGDNVQSDVENVLGGSGADTLVGSAAGNTLDGGSGEDYSDGGAGSDTLIGGDSGDVLRSRGSADADTIECGAGPDFVVAKPADTIAADCDRADRGVNQKPKLRDSAVVAPTTGTLQMSPTGIVRRVPLLDKVVLPLRSIVDTVAGAVNVTSSATTRKSQTIALQDGAFDITQTGRKLALTQFGLVGGDFGLCPAAPARGAATAAAAARVVRTLWAKGKGQFRTKGRFAAATVRGTRWQTVDRCDGTLIRVTQGAVAVQDIVKKKTVLVRAGSSYLAKGR